MKRVSAILLALGLFSTAPAFAASAGDVISGAGRAIDADIVAIGDQRIILWGLDAPERSQTCGSDNGTYSCYDDAIREAEELANNGEMSCTLMGDRPDPFGRWYGVCTAGGKEINAELVRAGLALAYRDQSEDYVAAEDEAKAAKLGLWRDGVTFVKPWQWRRTQNPGGFR